MVSSVGSYCLGSNKRVLNQTGPDTRKLFEIQWVCFCQSKVTFKARSHGTIFLLATAMQKMDCVEVNEGVHMVQFHVCAMHWCV